MPRFGVIDPVPLTDCLLHPSHGFFAREPDDRKVRVLLCQAQQHVVHSLVGLRGDQDLRVRVLCEVLPDDLADRRRLPRPRRSLNDKKIIGSDSGGDDLLLAGIEVGVDELDGLPPTGAPRKGGLPDQRRDLLVGLRVFQSGAFVLDLLVGFVLVERQAQATVLVGFQVALDAHEIVLAAVDDQLRFADVLDPQRHIEVRKPVDEIAGSGGARAGTGGEQHELPFGEALTVPRFLVELNDRTVFARDPGANVIQVLPARDATAARCHPAQMRLVPARGEATEIPGLQRTGATVERLVITGMVGNVLVCAVPGVAPARANEDQGPGLVVCAELDSLTAARRGLTDTQPLGKAVAVQLHQVGEARADQAQAGGLGAEILARTQRPALREIGTHRRVVAIDAAHRLGRRFRDDDGDAHRRTTLTLKIRPS